MPSEGYYNVQQSFFNTYVQRFLNPFNLRIFQKSVTSYENMKKQIFKTEWVQREMRNLAKKKLAEKHQNFT
jgi:hypothetical protein